MHFASKQPSTISKAAFPVFFALVVLAAVYSSPYAAGQTMTSGSYKIQSDSVNFGGARSSSATYTIEDTAGEVATGISSSTNYQVKAGYQQMQETYIALAPAADVAMSPAIGGITGGISNGSTGFTVTTDNPAGYTVTIKASSTPAMQSPLDTVADHSAGAANPSFGFTVPVTASAFAFTPEGTDIASTFKDDGASCNTGSGDTSFACWAGLSTAPQTIVSRTSANHPSGTLTTINFQVRSGSEHVLVAGIYVATTTITALPL
ncbi:MAG: hypothetical protein AAB365_00775 [Patescibacteria group bacterium]